MPDRPRVHRFIFTAAPLAPSFISTIIRQERIAGLKYG
jgi:hypothetical protein